MPRKMHVLFQKLAEKTFEGYEKMELGENLRFWQVLIRSFNVVEIIKIAG
ncbi:MAG: hypothetical protein JSV50_18510 [Desulfobacteraceae bacterium]|nr:MAG: hypothetical protein JSV50_18510 [Desulfobacteraceae bacterium]